MLIRQNEIQEAYVRISWCNKSYKLHGPKRNDKSIQYVPTNSFSIIYFHNPHYKIIYEGVEVIMLVLLYVWYQESKTYKMVLKPKAQRGT